MKRCLKCIRSTPFGICLAALILVLLACCGSNSSGNNDPIDEANIDETVAQLSTPEELSEYMLNNIPYTSETQRDESEKHGHSWKTPEETFEDGYGYCYDLSAFALHCLLEQGHEDAKLMFACYGDWGNESGSGHLVAYFTRNNKFWTINNGQLNGPYDTLSQVIDDAAFGNPVIINRTFTYEEIPFHTPYRDMEYFCDEE